MDISIQATEFKIKCLKLLEDVQNGNTYFITKRGVPLAKLEALASKPEKLFGAMKKSCAIVSDIVEPIDEIWDATK